MGQCKSKTAVNSKPKPKKLKPEAIEIPGIYVIMKEGKEQYVSIKCDNYGVYNYEYGLFNHHEGSCYINEIRELTEEEKQLHKNGDVFRLPNEFYHSAPVGMDDY
tara:strand:+ start:153 stop:467 length:315 start_codon:yes stop_codon:yes gene_type:complete